MYAAEVVVHEVESDCSLMVLDLLAECVGEASEATHGHTHCEVGALHKRCADVRRVWRAG